MLGAAFVALVAEVIGLLIAFGVDVTPDQRTAILGVIAAAGVLASLAGAWWSSRRVTPLSSPRDRDGQSLYRYDRLPQMIDTGLSQRRRRLDDQ